jgi:hypothetical protein
MTTPLRYRGVSYDPRNHEQLSDVPVGHIYRGQHYSCPLRHLPTAANSHVALHYRGIAYQHRPADLTTGA